MPTPSERFTDLFERTHAALLAYAVRRVADPRDAADVVAETYLVVWRRLDQVPNGEGERPWLFGVARKVVANVNRGVQRRRVLVDLLRADLVGVAPPPRLPSELGRALDGLRADDRELLLLLAWDGLSQAQAAVALGISHSAVRVRLHRARNRLRSQLADDHSDLADPTVLTEGINHA
ncbi:RNA polymerase sigma factor [Propionicimonas sp.]|uniref:RNA polymerase sigma factor n=1 Tax=Propionicimonas sp. TaxID=1955623 RepID=UPI0039E64493